MAKFKKGDHIYPNLEALDASMPYGHSWGVFRKGLDFCSKAERIAKPLEVRGAGKQYLLGPVDGSRGTRYNVEWVEQHFRSEAEQVAYLMDVSGNVYTTPQAIAARNQLMDIGDVLTKEVSAFPSFEDLLLAWPKCQYRPSLDVRNPKAKLLADIYDFAQAARGIKVETFRVGT